MSVVTSHNIHDKKSPIDFARHLNSQTAAMENFVAKGLPTPKLESWKYTSLYKISNKSFEFPAGSPNDINVEEFKIKDTLSVVFINGVLAKDHTDAVDHNSGVSIRVADKNYSGDTLDTDSFFSRAIDCDDQLTSLNASLVTNIVTIDVADNVALAKPIHVINIVDSSVDVMCHSACIVRVGVAAEVSLCESHISLGEGCCWLNAVTDIQLGASSNVSHYCVHRESLSSVHTKSVYIDQAKDSQFFKANMPLGVGLSRDNLSLSLNGVGAYCSAVSLCFARLKQHYDLNILVDHAASNTNSNQFIRNIAADSSVVAFTGQAKIQHGISSINADQTNNNLVLSDLAKIKIRPQLEVYSDDVQCSHGATVGQLDEMAIFYCRSRGISLEEAKLLLLSSYIEELFDSFPGSAVSSVLTSTLKSLVFENVSQFIKESGDE